MGRMCSAWRLSIIGDGRILVCPCDTSCRFIEVYESNIQMYRYTSQSPGQHGDSRRMGVGRHISSL